MLHTQQNILEIKHLIENFFDVLLIDKQKRYSHLGINYASPTSGEAYRNRRLTTNFEL